MKKKKRRLRKVWKVLLLSCLVIFLSVIGYGVYLGINIKSAANKTYEDFNREKSDLRAEEVSMGEDPITILLLGIEAYQGDTGRSDVILLFTVNPKTKETAMLSIPRDTRTYIPEVGYKDKINHSYVYGEEGQREKAVIESVEHLLDIPIDYYVSTNFKGFVEVVDQLGGITVDVPFDFTQPTMEGEVIHFKEGEMEVNGPEALAFVRMRKQDPRGDFGRIDRQQQAIKKMMDKALSFESVTKVDNVLNSLGENVKTNISLEELFAMRNFYQTIKNKQFDTLHLEGKDSYINDVYYFIPYEESINEVETKLKNILELENTDEPTSNSSMSN